MQQGTIFIVVAPSGAGKTTLVNALLDADPHVKLSVSYTTRTPREGEVNGQHYHFVSRDVFQAMTNQGEFLESAEVYGNYYGTSQRWIAEQLAMGNDILLEIDWQGALQVRKLFEDAVGIFILPPSLTALESRLRGRGKDSEETIQRRLAAARDDISHVDEFDYVVVNESLDVALADLIAIVHAQRLRLLNQVARYSALFTQLKGGSF
ncbi:guanylate kinase [Chitinivorax sp. B]|uniref:guanylate kinase n=1 Tax=Chitinivorax sp. B TaxID=2502235 RepID=UPI0010F58B02|nr:guanylate kinase [Chitinivorax sp. B]